MTLEPIQYLLGALSGSLVGFTLGLVGGGGHGGSFGKFDGAMGRIDARIRPGVRRCNLFRGGPTER